MKRYLPLFALAFTACASYNQLMVDPNGNVMSCDSSGGGLIGMAYAAHVSNNCIVSRHAAGFIEIEQAGAVGLGTNDDGVVIKVVPGGPADVAGIKVADRVIAVNGVAVSGKKEIQPLMFGKSGEALALKVRRDKTDLEFKMVMKSWSEVNGIKPNPVAAQANAKNSKLSAEDMRH